jgi:hypothetical protein
VFLTADVDDKQTGLKLSRKILKFKRDGFPGIKAGLFVQVKRPLTAAISAARSADVGQFPTSMGNRLPSYRHRIRTKVSGGGAQDPML